MIPKNVHEFLKQYGCTASFGDVTMMRLQRLLNVTNPGVYDIKRHYGRTKINSWYTVESPGPDGLISIIATPWDGSVHFNWNEAAHTKYDRKIIDVAVPKSKRGFNSENIKKALYYKYKEEVIEQDRLARLRPFMDELSKYLMRGRKIVITSGNRIDNNTIRIDISGYFTLDEAKAALKGLYESHVMDEDLCRLVIES